MLQTSGSVCIIA